MWRRVFLGLFVHVLVLSAFSANSEPLTVLVTGATGRTGVALFTLLKQKSIATRALVRSISKAREVLNCSKCDASEGIYVGDVTQPDTLTAALTGVDTVAIAIGAPGNASSSLEKQIDYEGVINQVAAHATLNGPSKGLPNLRVVLCSSLGTTVRNPPAFMGGTDLFWKLNAEAFLGASQVGSVVVKPCGLGSGAGGTKAIAAFHDDKIPVGSLGPIDRADVAAVMAEAVTGRYAGLRFGLCSGKNGPPTAPKAVLAAAKYPWA